MDPKKMALIDELVKKVGGRYKLTVLIQKRMRELNRDPSTLFEKNPMKPFDRVLHEINEGTIELVDEEEYRKYIRDHLASEGAEQLLQEEEAEE